MFEVDEDSTRLDPHLTLDWLAAVHEAGHAVAACLCGFNLRDVSIESAYRCRANLKMADDSPATAIGALTAEMEERDAIYTLAGGRAEMLLLVNDGVEALSASDREYLETLASGIRDKRERHLWKIRMETVTDDLLMRHRGSLLKVASELLAQRRLSGTRVQQILSTMDR